MGLLREGKGLYTLKEYRATQYELIGSRRAHMGQKSEAAGLRDVNYKDG